jgi:fluoroquinolone transport system permease protein
MTRFLAAIKVDVMVQVRNNLYTIGIVIAVITAAMLAWLGSADQLPALVPTLMLLVVGGSTFLYIGALIFFEKEQGTLNATIVSPMRPSEYLWSKIATLTGLATLEAVIMIGGGTLIMSFSESLSLPNIPLLLLGIVIMGILYTLAGIILMVRYDKITDFLVPLALIVSFLQLPFLYFWGIFELPFLLVIPTSAPAMLMRGAFVPLAAWEWLYAVGYSAVLLTGLSVWAYRAFHAHIILKVG